MTALDKYLKDKKLTNEVFARLLESRQRGRINASPGWVSQIRNGTKAPSPKLARRIAEVTDGAVSFAELIDTGAKSSAA